MLNRILPFLGLLTTLLTLPAAADQTQACDFSVTILQNTSVVSDDLVRTFWQKIFYDRASNLGLCPIGRNRDFFVKAETIKTDTLDITYSHRADFENAHPLSVQIVGSASTPAPFVQDEVHALAAPPSSYTGKLIFEFKMAPEDGVRLFISDYEWLTVRRIFDHFAANTEMFSLALNADGSLKALSILEDLVKKSRYSATRITVNNHSISDLPGVNEKTLNKMFAQTFRQYTAGESVAQTLMAFSDIYLAFGSGWNYQSLRQIDFTAKACRQSGKVTAGLYSPWEKKIELCARSPMEDEGYTSEVSDLRGVLIHEIGHHFHYSLPSSLKDQFKSIGWSSGWFSKRTLDEKEFVSKYAATDEKEDFAESFKRAINFKRRIGDLDMIKEQNRQTDFILTLRK